MESWQHEYKEVNGIKLHYVKAGQGPLVILLHGFPEFWYSWRNQIPALSEHFTVVAPDMRGYGKSDKPKGVKNYATKVIAKDIIELIESFGEKKAHIVAHDWGGGVAWTIAQFYPEYIDKLVVLNCPLPAILMKHFFTNFKQVKRSWYMFFFQIPWLPEWRMRKNLKVFFKRGLRGWAHNKDAFTDEDINRYVEAFQDPYALTAAVNYYRASFRSIFDKEARKIRPMETDTLVIWGEDDEALGKELTYGMEKYFKNNFEIKYISDCSHWVQHEYPDLVNGYILDFLRKPAVSSAASH